MKFSYSALIVILFSQLTHAHDINPSALCRQIKKDQDQNNLCETISSRYPSHRRIVKQNCDDVLHNLRENSFEADKFCSDTFEALAEVAKPAEVNYLVAPTITSAGSRGPTSLQETPPTISAGMNKCQPKPLESYSCDIGDPFSFTPMAPLLLLPENFPEYSVSVQNAKFGDDECNCFKKQSENSIRAKGLILFEAEVKKEENRINEVVFQAAAVRILNSFAANLEDISFYRSNKTSLIGGDEAARKLQCNDVSQYRAKVTAACGGKVPQDVIDKRMSDIMTSLGDAKEEKTIEEKFAKVQSKVLDVLLSKDVQGQKKSLTRLEYDKIRFGAARGLKEVTFINEVTDALMDHHILGKELQHAMDVEKHNPGRAIFTMLRDEKRPEVKELLLKIARDPRNRGELSNNIIAVLQTPNKDDLGTLIDDRLQKTLDMHPSLRAIFRSRDLFDKVREASHEAELENSHAGGTHSILTQLEENPAFMKGYFEERCGRIQDQFAEAVCVQDNNFVGQASPEDLNMLLSTMDKEVNPNLKDLILCRIPKNQNPKSVFKKLAFKKWDRLSQSDYWREKNNKGESDDSFLSSVRNIVQSGNKDAYKFLGSLSEMGDSFRMPDADFVSSVSKKDSFSFLASTTKAEPIAEKEREYALAKGLSNLSESLGGTTDVNAPNVVIPGLADYTAPGPVPGADNNVMSRDKKDTSKSELRDFLSDEENSGEVDKHLSNIKTEDQLELIRLRDELSKNKEMLMSLTSQVEQNKLKALQERYQALENAKPTQTAVAEAESSNEVVRSNSRTSSSMNNATNALTPSDVLRDNNVTSSSQTSGAESGAGTSASRSPSSIGNARVNSAGSDSNLAFSSSPKGEILIEQSGSTFANGQQLAPEDLGLVIQRYVEQTELDVQTLKQLKDQEVVIKYKVVENGVEVLKTMKVKSTALTPETKKFLAAQIAIKEKEVERLEARRAHSFATLKLLLGIKTKSMY